VLKLGLIRTFLPWTGFIFSTWMAFFTPCFRSPVFTNATLLAVVPMIKPPLLASKFYPASAFLVITEKDRIIIPETIFFPKKIEHRQEGRLP